MNTYNINLINGHGQSLVGQNNKNNDNIRIKFTYATNLPLLNGLVLFLQIPCH